MANRVGLREQLHSCMLKKDEKIDDYIARWTATRLALTDINEAPSESDRINTVVKGVKTKYKSLVESIKVSMWTSCLTIKDHEEAQAREASNTKNIKTSWQ